MTFAPATALTVNSLRKYAFELMEVYIMNAIIHYEVIMNIALIVLVVCLATYTYAQDMRLRKYKILLAKRSDRAQETTLQGKPAIMPSRLAA